MAIYILIKKKGAKRYSSVYKAKPGVTASKLRKQLSKSLSKQVTYRLANFNQVKRIILSQRPRIKSSKTRIKKRGKKLRVRKNPVRRKKRVVKRRIKSRTKRTGSRRRRRR